MGGEGGRDVQVIVKIVERAEGSPCRKTRVMVSTVPVEGAQVILKGVPAVMELRDVNVKGFCAKASEDRAPRRRVVEKCIL